MQTGVLSPFCVFHVVENNAQTPIGPKQGCFQQIDRLRSRKSAGFERVVRQTPLVKLSPDWPCTRSQRRSRPRLWIAAGSKFGTHELKQIGSNLELGIFLEQLQLFVISHRPRNCVTLLTQFVRASGTRQQVVRSQKRPTKCFVNLNSRARSTESSQIRKRCSCCAPGPSAIATTPKIQRLSLNDRWM